jgi:hypothetical protein
MLDKVREKDERAKVWLPFKEFLQDEYRRMNPLIRLDQGAAVLLCVAVASVGMYTVPFQNIHVPHPFHKFSPAIISWMTMHCFLKIFAVGIFGVVFSNTSTAINRTGFLLINWHNLRFPESSRSNHGIKSAS